jgi:acyl-CoA thioesterase
VIRHDVEVTAFERDTAVRALADGSYACRISADWFTPRGPNGGYLAAVVVRAMEAVVDDPQRAPRSLTLHYLRPPAAGEATIDVTVERAGRNLTTLSARMTQGDQLCVLALGAFSSEFTAPAEYASAMDGVPAAEEIERLMPHPKAPPIAQRLDLRPTEGTLPFSGADEALVGAWVRFDEHSRVDAAFVALAADALLPTPWTRLTALAPAPTVDLTIHFRARVDLPAGSFVHGRFWSTHLADGFFEEDGEIRAPDGTLLAQSRQLGILLAP